MGERVEEITVLGGGLAGLTLIKKLREKNSSLKITLIDKNPYSFNKRDFIASFSLKDWIELKTWCQNNNVEFILDGVEKINPSRRKIYFKESQSQDFQVLIVACGLVCQKMSIKGEHRQGFFYLSQIDPFRLKDLLKISSEVVVYVSTFLGLKLSLSLNSLRKEVKIVGGSWDFLGEEKERVMDFLKERNISLYLDSSIEETIGEGVVKATKISPLKVFSSQLVFIDSGFSSNDDFFEQEIKTKGTFFTNCEGVYLLGDVNRKDSQGEFFFGYNHEEAIIQANIFAHYLLEGALPVFEAKSTGLEDRQKIIRELWDKK